MNTLGNLFRFSSFGESHGQLVGVIVDGCPPGLQLSEAILNKGLKERRPGSSDLVTQRKEDDSCEIVSGILKNKTTGAPITVLIRNKDVSIKDYDEIKKKPRPGHADYPAYVKYQGLNDFRGGGRFSGRLTIAHVVAGVIAEQMLKHHNITVDSEIVQIGDTHSDFESKIQEVKEAGDSIGGIIRTTVKGLPVGLGEPLYKPTESVLSHAIFTIPGIVGIEFGDGFKSAQQLGSEHNDSYTYREGKIALETNHCGGVLGGMTVGSPMIFNVVVKPTSSIGLPQHTVDLEKKEPTMITIRGRHDPSIVLRATPVVKYTTWFVLADLFMMAGYMNNSHVSKVSKKEE
ncbi:MAG: chorismate synthase [Candidatus Ranarchaeia archaeon]|jgi:chorismate synthase